MPERFFRSGPLFALKGFYFRERLFDWIVSGGLNPYLFGGFSEKVGVGDDRARQGLTSGGRSPDQSQALAGAVSFVG